MAPFFSGLESVRAQRKKCPWHFGTKNACEVEKVCVNKAVSLLLFLVLRESLQWGDTVILRHFYMILALVNATVVCSVERLCVHAQREIANRCAAKKASWHRGKMMMRCKQ